MSDFPERISISPVHRQKRDDDFYLVDRKAFPGKGTEYIRADVAQAMVAAAREDALREAAEVCERIREQKINGPMPERACFDYEQSIRALAEKE